MIEPPFTVSPQRGQSGVKPGGSITLLFTHAMMSHVRVVSLVVPSDQVVVVPRGETRCTINETMAPKYWPGESPVGRKIWVWHDEKFHREIVGVVGDTRASLETAAESQMYVPFSQDAGWGSLSLVVRTNGEPTAFAGAVRNQIKAVDKGMVIYNLKTLDDVVATAVSPRRTPMLLLSSLAGVAMLLAMRRASSCVRRFITVRRLSLCGSGSK